MFVLIVGGRYGSEVGDGKRPKSRTFFDRYESITKTEYETAVGRDMPIYIFVEAGVYAEYMTYQRNKDNEKINYAHVDSVNIFRLIEEVLSKPRNNPVKTFEKYGDIEAWLREQWAGLFRELLNSKSSEQQLNALSAQVGQLAEVNETLRKYLEAVVSETVQNSTVLISSEQRRLHDAKVLDSVRANRWFRHLNDVSTIDVERFVEVTRLATSIDEYCEALEKVTGKEDLAAELASTLMIELAQLDLNEIRRLLGVAEFLFDDDLEELVASAPLLDAPKSPRSSRSRKAGKPD